MRAFLVFTAIILSLDARVVAAGLDQAQLQAALDEALDTHPTARRTTVALKVIDVETGDVLYDRFGDRLFTPASNLKIYTSACALDLFGPQHRFPTQIVGRVDRPTKTIQGDLKLLGGGNAMLSSKELKQLADGVVGEWGVRNLRGEVVVDNSRYSATRLGPGWMWDDQPYYFNMQVTPLMVDFNVETLPEQLDATGKPVRRAVADPQERVARTFTKMLRDRGVKIDGPHENKPASSEMTLTHNGSDLAATLKHFNHVSENAVGEVLLHEIAIAKGIAQPSWPDGAAAITAWLHDTAGLEEGSFRLVDGSGLSRYNLISADSSVKLVAFMRRHQHYQTFYDALSAYEVETGDGKQRELVRAKSGGMSGVSTISGYAQTLAGRQLAFSLLGNGFIGSKEPMFALRKKVWSVLVQYDAAN